MIEIALAAAYRGIPDEIGAWAYQIRGDEGAGPERSGRGRPAAIASRLSAEAAALALALEELAPDGSGEAVTVRTASAGLQGLLLRRGSGVAADLAQWYARISRAARRFSTVSILPASPEDLAALQTHLHILLPEGRGTPIDRLRARLPERRGSP